MKHIQKQDLVKGMYYKGFTNNSWEISVVRWDGDLFRHWRDGYLEYIPSSAFFATEATDTDKEIPLES